MRDALLSEIADLLSDVTLNPGQRAAPMQQSAVVEQAGPAESADE